MVVSDARREGLIKKTAANTLSDEFCGLVCVDSISYRMGLSVIFSIFGDEGCFAGIHTKRIGYAIKPRNEGDHPVGECYDVSSVFWCLGACMRIDFV